VSDAVDRVLQDRQALDRGFPGSLLLSSTAHALVVALAFGAHLLFPAEPPLKVQDGFVVALPPGGQGTPNAHPAPAPAQPRPAAPEPEPPPAAKPEPLPKILKPPKEPPKKGLPDPTAGRKGKPEKSPPPRSARGGAPGGTGTSSQTPGLEFGPPGPGVPGGTDPFGDWYLAAVQRKIWMLWSQQVRTATAQQLTVSFTILADGSVSDVRVIQPSGVFLLDQAAQRAILNAAPFGPLPKDYGTNRLTIQAIFRQTS
jgi:TonB family protein